MAEGPATRFELYCELLVEALHLDHLTTRAAHENVDQIIWCPATIVCDLHNDGVSLQAFLEVSDVVTAQRP